MGRFGIILIRIPPVNGRRHALLGREIARISVIAPFTPRWKWRALAL
jgi:hypothetical protein